LRLARGDQRFGEPGGGLSRARAGDLRERLSRAQLRRQLLRGDAQVAGGGGELTRVPAMQAAVAAGVLARAALAGRRHGGDRAACEQRRYGRSDDYLLFDASHVDHLARLP